MARPIDDSHVRIRETILSNMPKEAEITRIEFLVESLDLAYCQEFGGVFCS